VENRKMYSVFSGKQEDVQCVQWKTGRYTAYSVENRKIYGALSSKQIQYILLTQIHVNAFI
jgi:hypothetical protein